MKIISPWIQLTNECNLNCQYCFIEQEKGSMELSIFENINKRFSYLLDNEIIESCQYRIAGGEPTLYIERYFNLIQNMIDKYPSRFNVELITNGTLINENLIKFLSKNCKHIGLCLSLDSLKFSKPMRNNISTSNIVLKNIRRINKVDKNIGISISTVILNDGDDLPDLSKYIIKNNLYWDINFDKMNTSNINIKKVKINILKLIKEVIKNNYDIHRIQFNGIDFRKNEGCCAGKRLIAIDTKGKEWPCQTTFNRKEIKEWDIKKCKGCEIINYCGCGCKFNNFSRDNFCEVIKFYFKIGGSYAISL